MSDERDTTVCGDCGREECECDTTECEICGTRVDYEYALSPYGAGYGRELALCYDCHSERYTSCDSCGDYSPDLDVRYIDGMHFCGDCYNDRYTECDECGETIESDSACYDSNRDAYVCEYCYRDSDSGIICDYHGADKTARFFGDGAPYYIGTEVEVETRYGYDREEAAQAARDAMPDGALHFEHDGSLDNGFEAITAPLSMEWIAEHADDIKAAFDAMAAHGCRSHDTTTCGLHVHVSWSAVGRFPAEIDYTTAKLVHLTDRIMPDIEAVAQRARSSWAREYDTADVTEADYKAKRAKAEHDRYHVWNVTNRDTIEWRASRGTLRFHTWYATVLLVDMLIRAARNMTLEDAQTVATLRDALAFARYDIPTTLAEYLADRSV